MLEALLELIAAVIAVLVAVHYLLPRLSEDAGRSNVATASPRSPARQTPDIAGSGTDRQGASYGRVELRPDQAGQYHAAVEIDGKRRPMPSDFKIKMMTANGDALAALTRLREVRVDTLLVDDVQAVVVPEGSRERLLGVTFLKSSVGSRSMPAI